MSPIPNRAKLGVAVRSNAAPASMSHLRRLVSVTFIKPPAVAVELHALRTGRVQPVQGKCVEMCCVCHGLGGLEVNPRKRVSAGSCPKKQESEHDCDDHPGDSMHCCHSRSASWRATCETTAMHSAPPRF